MAPSILLALVLGCEPEAADPSDVDGVTTEGRDATDDPDAIHDSGLDDTADSGGPTDSGGGGSADFDPSLLDDRGGCGDVTLYAQASDQSWNFVFDAPEVINAARDANGTDPTVLEYDLSAGGVLVYITYGVHLTRICDDVGDRDALNYNIWYPESGSATLTVEPEEEEAGPFYDNPARASAVLLDVLLESKIDGTTIELESYTFQNSAVGWAPG